MTRESNSGSYGKCQASREIGLDQPGHHISARALSCHYQMDAGGTCHLCKPDEVMFGLVGCRHHQVGQLIDHDHDTWEGLDILPSLEAAVISIDIAGLGGFQSL